MSPLAISWVLSSISGYGIYGLQIIMQYLRRGGKATDLVLTANSSVIVMPPLDQARINHNLATGLKLYKFLQANPEEVLNFDHPVLHGCGNDFAGFQGQERIWGKPNIACAAIEHLLCTPQGREATKHYTKFIAISRWNADFLKSLDIGPVHLCHQGIDPSLFHPAPGSGLYRDRFVIFSGGKFEFRKGQDIVLAAFKIFHGLHPDALLVACWQNMLRPEVEAFALAGYIDSTPQIAPGYGLQITDWILQQGLPPDSFIDLPFTHNLLMPSILHDCDMAIFPNRCEGGTNLVAMEAMACGVPVYVAYNTGQKDLVDLMGCGALRAQNKVKQSSDMRTVEDWGETTVDEAVASMEYVYANREASRSKGLDIAARMKDWSWSDLNEKLLQIVCDGKTGL